jgi:hypothetical protein
MSSCDSFNALVLDFSQLTGKYKTHKDSVSQLTGKYKTHKDSVSQLTGKYILMFKKFH